MNSGYIAGTRIIDGIDESRDETLGQKTGKRVLMARLYYPSTDTAAGKFVHTKLTAGDMYENALPASDKKFPLIVFNHGYTGYVEINNSLCCALAQNGYFVVSVGHAFEAWDITLSNGSRICLDKSVQKKMIEPRFEGTMAAIRLKFLKGSDKKLYTAFNEFQNKYCRFMMNRLPVWANDIQATVELVRKEYADFIDFDNGIGITGHSFGGNLSYYMCMHFDEYKCGINIDGGIFGDYTGMRMKKPFLQICQKSNLPVVSRVFIDNDAEVQLEVMDKVKHMGFTDMKYFRKSKFMFGSMPAEEIQDRLKTLHLEFFSNSLKK